MTAIRYPAAARADTVDVLHGRRVADPYRWLEEPDDPVSRRWLAEQQTLTDAYLRSLPGQDRLRATLGSMTVHGPTASAVTCAGTRRFRVERAAVAWQMQVGEGTGDRWRTVIRADELGDAAVLRRWQPSPDGRHLAVQVGLGGAEDATPLSVVDVETGLVVESCPLTRYSPVQWRADGATFYYVRRHGDRPGAGVYLHRLGTGPAADELLLGDDSPVRRYHIALWHDRWLVVTERNGTSRTTRVTVADVHRGQGPRRLPIGGLSSAGVLVGTDGRILATSTEPAELGQLLVADPLPDGNWGAWRVLVAEAEPAVLAGAMLSCVDGQGRLAVLHTVDGCSRMAVHDAVTGERLLDVELPGDGTVTAVGLTDDPAVLALSYTDWVTPPSVWQLDVRSGRVTPVGDAPAALSDVSVTRTTYRSGDGTRVPVTVLAPREAQGGPRTPRPTVLTCYGGFGISFGPRFQPDMLAWVRSGGLLVIAGIRGGGERGRQWHRAGSGPNKVNAFADLHAAGDWLVRTGRTRRDQLALLGGSNGGLLVCGAVVQRPHAYAAVVSAGAPLDMVRYERWGLGKAWRDEYGTVEDPAAFAAILRYSPYHNITGDVAGMTSVRARRWPPALFCAGNDDTRVAPVHSCKMVARLQDATEGGPVLLKVIEGMGHTGGAESSSDLMAVTILAFLARHTGLVLDRDEEPGSLSWIEAPATSAPAAESTPARHPSSVVRRRVTSGSSATPVPAAPWGCPGRCPGRSDAVDDWLSCVL